ncbi:hypothetical protein MIND_01297100 [Mycena indigotica]|uniref:Uncharacterized protein n=1 Tax=Mycena indigotica TaxID=2126181 RepID=A0A8H6RZH6_9AGAR|nr:uncharacterized protein MIND_01297100 [Mycena indigotica]KAF7290570.1 hypothetical protein MIND_01297100 [Mycena indigotica]
MSSINNTIPTNTTSTTGPARPEHHIHHDSEPLPGARGAAPAADYSPDNMERVASSTWQQGGDMKPSRELGDIASDERAAAHHHDSHTAGNVQFDEHPSGDHPDERHPTRKATAADKLIGKAQEVAGKVAKKPELQEKGVLRQTEGKSAM